MALAHSRFTSFEDYIKLKEESIEILEYIDGVICMSPSPSIKHQLISSNLHTEFGIFLKGKKCRVFAAPTDIQLSIGDVEDKKLVIPDLSIICDDNKFTDNRYVGVPSLIVEILSPRNQAHDLVTKFNLYMKYGVPEYWIINPMKQAITVYNLNEDGLYEQSDIKTINGIIESVVIEGFKVELETIFS
ncbi:MAG: Uma2 family endonuclease [Clostridium sp.]